MGKIATMHPEWEVVDWFDIYPGVGAFVSPTTEDYVVHGRTINALNWLHAEYLWLKQVLAESGQEFYRCCHCNQVIRYVVVFRDPQGLYHGVGQACASFIQSGLDRTAWDEKKKLSDIKETKGGAFCLTLPVPEWYWQVPKDKRPASFRTWKGQARGRNAAPWFLSIWGASPHEVLKNWEGLKGLRALAEDPKPMVRRSWKVIKKE